MTIQTHTSSLSDKRKLKIISFAASVLSGFFGAAGALFFNWIVQSWLGRDMKRVNGLALFTISISAMISIVIRVLWPVQAIQTDWQKAQIVIISIAFGMMGVVLGHLHEKRLHEKHLRKFFVGLLLFTGFKLIGIIPEQFFYLPVEGHTATAFLSLIAGISSPLLGIGAGVFLIPTFLGIGFVKDEAILGSLIVSAFLMFLGVLLFHRDRRLDAEDLRRVWLPAILGTPLGVWVSYHVSPSYFQSLFGILLIIAAFKTLYDVSTRFRRIVRVVFFITVRPEHEVF